MKNLINLIKQDALDIGGRCPINKGEVIKSLVQKTNAKICVEIGVFKGSSLMYFIESLMKTNGKVFGIDPYKISNFVNNIPDQKVHTMVYDVLFKEQETLDTIYNNLVKIIEENNLSNFVKIYRQTSEECIENFEPNSIDILHIDGNHDEEFVTKDILNYLPLVKKGSFIIMDDITWIGVKNSINNHLVDNCDLVHNYTDFAVYVKK